MTPAAYKDRLIDLWEQGLASTPRLPADVLIYLEWLFSMEYVATDGQESCKNCGRHVRIVGEPHVLGVICSDQCQQQNREHYA